MLSRTSFRLFYAILAFSSLYRICLTALLVLRQRFLANLSSLAPHAIHRNLTPRQSERGVDERTTRARFFSRLVRFIKSDGTAPALAALAAAPTLALLPGADDFPWTYLASYTTVHSLSSLYAEARAVESRLVRWVPDWCDSALLYAIGNGQLLWSFVFERDTFPKGYGRMIVGRSSAYIPPRPAHTLPEGVQWPSSDTVVDHIAKLATPTPTSSAFPTFTSPVLSSLTPSRHPTTPYKAINPILDYSPAHPEHANLMCAMLHPTEPSCRKTLLNHFRAEWPASARIAGVFTAVASVLLRRKHWLHDPETELFNLVVATLQAATIISGSIGSAWAMICLLQQYLPRNFLPQKRFFLNGFLSGVWIFVVPKSRRQTLGLYVARMSAVSTWRVLEKRGKVRRPAYGKQILLALGLAMMAGMHEAEVGSMSRMLRAASKRLFGERIVVQARSEGEDGAQSARPRRGGGGAKKE